MNNKVYQGFVVFQSEFENELLRIDSLDKISIDCEMNANNLIDCVNVFINGEHWSAFDGQGTDDSLEYKLQKEILGEIAKNLSSNVSSIDFELLISNCIKKVKDKQ